jgi:hypothetical protein
MNVFFDGTLKKCDIYKAHLELAINGLKTNDCSVPLVRLFKKKPSKKDKYIIFDKFIEKYKDKIIQCFWLGFF